MRPVSNWPNAIVFGLAVLGALQVLRALVNIIFCHCGKPVFWCRYTMWRELRRHHNGA